MWKLFSVFLVGIGGQDEFECQSLSSNISS